MDGIRVENREERAESSAWTLCSGRPKVENREKRVEGSAWLARLGAPARQNRRASLCGFSLCPLTGTAMRAQARQPRTTFFSLLPSPYFTENKRVVPSSVSCRISRASRSLIESSSSWYWVFSGGVKDSSAKRSLPFRSAIPSLSAGRSSR